MRLVLDTNVVVSALLWGGLPYQLLQLAVDGEVTLYTSPALVAELSEILVRPHSKERLTNQGTDAQAIAELYRSFAFSVEPASVPRVVPDDPDDDHVVACAVAAGAHLIVTGDKHLLKLVGHQGIGIVTVGQAVTMARVGGIPQG
jgi:putative PIN family toxin of toxin-antitoxin system